MAVRGGAPFVNTKMLSEKLFWQCLLFVVLCSSLGWLLEERTFVLSRSRIQGKLECSTSLGKSMRTLVGGGLGLGMWCLAWSKTSQMDQTMKDSKGSASQFMLLLYSFLCIHVPADGVSDSLNLTVPAEIRAKELHVTSRDIVIRFGMETCILCEVSIFRSSHCDGPGSNLVFGHALAGQWVKWLLYK